jgi:membrane protein
MLLHQDKFTPLWAVALAAVVAFSQRRGGSQARGKQSMPAVTKELAGRTKGEAGRGRDADTPAEIPPRGWKDIAYRVYEGISEDRIVAISAGVTFFVVLAVFPGIAGLISLYGLVADPSTMGQHLNALAGVMPEGGTKIIGEQIDRLASQPAGKLGLGTIAGLAISLWSANGGMKAIFDALNVVYHEKEKRGFFKLNATSLSLTFGALVFLIVALATLTLAPLVMEWIGLPTLSVQLTKWLRWPLLFLAASFFIAVIYRYGPSRDIPKWRWITPGSALAAGLWLAASLLFSWYAEHFGSYDKTYGSLGAAIGLMTWLWISTMVILVGAKLNAETEHQTAQDSTEGASQELGRRRAVMADTVGKPSPG